MIGWNEYDQLELAYVLSFCRHAPEENEVKTIEEKKAYNYHVEQLAKIKKLVEQGTLGRELCPEPNYWRWPILKPEEFREWIPFREVRW